MSPQTIAEFSLDVYFLLDNMRWSDGGRPLLGDMPPNAVVNLLDSSRVKKLAGQVASINPVSVFGALNRDAAATLWREDPERWPQERRKEAVMEWESLATYLAKAASAQNALAWMVG